MESAQRTVADKISAFVNDPDVRLFEERFKRTTDLFEAMGIARAENPHSDFIAWILDSKRNPGLGTHPVKLLVYFLSKGFWGRNERSLDEATVALYSHLLAGDFDILSSECRREVATFGQEKNGRIDILVSCVIEIGKMQKRLNVVIENKVESDTHGNQLECYYRFVTQNHRDSINLFALLAPNPERISEKHHIYVPVSYQALNNNVFQPLLNDASTSIRARVLIEEYIHTLSRLEDKKHIKLIAMTETDRNLLLAFYEKHGELIHDMLFSLREALPEEDRQKYNALEDTIGLFDEVIKSSRLSYTVDGKKMKYLSDFAKEVVARYIDKHPDITIEALRIVFKAVDGMINPKPFINTTNIANDGRKRWKDSGYKVCQESDGTMVSVYTSTQWTSDSIRNFEAFVRTNIAPALGIKIECKEN